MHCDPQPASVEALTPGRSWEAPHWGSFGGGGKENTDSEVKEAELDIMKW